MSDREFDVVIFGASGYTGKLVAEYMHDQYGNDHSIKYAIAGRNIEKLLEVKKDLRLNAVSYTHLTLPTICSV